MKILENLPAASEREIARRSEIGIMWFLRLSDTDATQWNEKGEKLILNRILIVTKSCTLEYFESVFISP